jgi:ATP-binding cassette, subfamily A (ABC1), member 3
MGRSRFSLFIKQTWTLTKKILLIAVVRHWFSTLFCSLILPIPYLVLLLNIKHFLGYDSTYGVGTPQPVNSLLASIPSSKKFAIVQSPDLGPDVDTVVNALIAPLQHSKQLVFLNDVNDLLTTCREDLHGSTDCFAAVVFNDSPKTPGKNRIWNYTIRADSNQNGSPFHAETHNNDEDRIYLPLQVALENAITNSSIIPNEYMFTSVSQATGDEQNREQYQQVVIRSYGVAFFIAFASVIYHLIGMVTSERESGMTQLIDAMGGSAAARICSYVVAFDIIYLPCWILFGVCESLQTKVVNLNIANHASVLERTFHNLKRRNIPLLASPDWHSHNKCQCIHSHVL